MLSPAAGEAPAIPSTLGGGNGSRPSFGVLLRKDLERGGIEGDLMASHARSLSEVFLLSFMVTNKNGASLVTSYS